MRAVVGLDVSFDLARGLRKKLLGRIALRSMRAASRLAATGAASRGQGGIGIDVDMDMRLALNALGLLVEVEAEAEAGPMHCRRGRCRIAGEAGEDDQEA